MATEKPDFLFEEYKALREEILFHAKHSRWLENAFLVGAAAVYAWVASKSPSGTLKVIWWVPLVISALCIIREYGNRGRNSQIAEYLSKIEGYFKNETGPNGWENHLKELRKDMKNRPLTISAYAFWIASVTFTFLVAISYGL